MTMICCLELSEGHPPRLSFGSSRRAGLVYSHLHLHLIVFFSIGGETLNEFVWKWCTSKASKSNKSSRVHGSFADLHLHMFTAPKTAGLMFFLLLVSSRLMALVANVRWNSLIRRIRANSYMVPGTTTYVSLLHSCHLHLLPLLNPHFCYICLLFLKVIFLKKSFRTRLAVST